MSSTNCRNASRRNSASGTRRSDDGCTVASSAGAQSDLSTSPRAASRGSRGRAATAPRSRRGRRSSSGGRPGSPPPATGGTRPSRGLGFWWMRRLPARLELEVLDGVGDVASSRGRRRPPRGRRRATAPAARRTAARAVLLVAGLLADEHDRGVGRALAEDGLRRVAVERAAAAAPGGVPQHWQFQLRWQKVRRGAGSPRTGAFHAIPDSWRGGGRIRGTLASLIGRRAARSRGEFVTVGRLACAARFMPASGRVELRSRPSWCAARLS